jgi:hypothetical protein
MSSFYIGYLPQAPDDLRRFLRRAVGVLITAAATVAVTLILAQQKFSPAVFEYTTVREFEGVLDANPYPSLLVDEPGKRTRYLLVGVGKHGFREHLGEYEGKAVRLRAKKIYRQESSMLEVMPGSITPAPIAVPVQSLEPVNFGSIEAAGEIVDTKCFLGVMNPGRSKVHRDCAARCLSGGVPPALLVEGSGTARLYQLANAAGGPLEPSTFLDRVGEQVEVRGTLWRLGDSYTIRTTDISRR